MEIELKYAVEADLFSHLLQQQSLDIYEIGSASAQELTDRYLDTPGRDILRGGYACRLRQVAGGDTVRVTLKGFGASDGALHRREEHEIDVPRGADPGDWPESTAKDLVLQLRRGGALCELVVIHQQRSLHPVLRNGAQIATLSYDLFEVEGSPRRPQREVEIELGPAGDVADLRALGRSLESQGARPETRSKFERALALLDQGGAADNGARAASPPPAPPPTPPAGNAAAAAAVDDPAASAGKPAAPRRKGQRALPGVRSDEPMAEAGRKILGFHFERMLANESGTRDGSDIEALHDMRVATRRQRAILRIVAPEFRRKVIRPFRSELRLAAQRLGAVRDLDVQIEAATRYRDSLPTERGRAFQPVLAAWQQFREAARAELLLYLDSSGYRNLTETFSRFLHTPGAGTRRSVRSTEDWTPHRVRDLLPGRIWEQYGAVRAYEPRLACASVATLHGLRIEAKRLRYTLEFFREALDPCAEEAIAALTALQDHLGSLHDADVTTAMLRGFTTSQAGTPAEAAALTAAVGGYFKAQSARLQRLRSTLGRPWRRVSGKRFKQLLARSTLAL